MSYLSTHILDITVGAPAVGVEVSLFAPNGALIAREVTDDDGRVLTLGPKTLPAGNYRIEFATGIFFAQQGQATLHPRVSIHVTIDPEQPHYHIPLLLSPFAYSTYRGS